jgi:hypothetical protein
MNDHDNPRPKRPYRKPELVLVPLRPEEAVLGVCKGVSAGGPGRASVCSGATCRGQGS